MRSGKFIREMNILRLSKRPYRFTGSVAGRNVHIVGEGTWLQVFIVDGTDYGNCEGRLVREFESDLLRPLCK